MCPRCSVVETEGGDCLERGDLLAVGWELEGGEDARGVASEFGDGEDTHEVAWEFGGGEDGRGVPAELDEGEGNGSDELAGDEGVLR